MATVIRCDACLARLAGEAIAVTFTRTTRVVDHVGEARLIDSGVTEDHLLCEQCHRYLQRCVVVLEQAGGGSA